MYVLYALIFLQVAGVDLRFEEKMRGIVEYMQFRELSAELKRKVCTNEQSWHCNPSLAPAVHITGVQLGAFDELGSNLALLDRHRTIESKHSQRP